MNKMGRVKENCSKRDMSPGTGLSRGHVVISMLEVTEIQFTARIEIFKKQKRAIMTELIYSY